VHSGRSGFGRHPTKDLSVFRGAHQSRRAHCHTPAALVNQAVDWLNYFITWSSQGLNNRKLTSLSMIEAASRKIVAAFSGGLLRWYRGPFA
jgi:hypothetical protein